MPYTRFQAMADMKDHYKLRVLLRGTMKAKGVGWDDLEDILKCSRPTAHRRMTNVGTMTLDELLSLGRGLHIPIDELREAIRY